MINDKLRLVDGFRGLPGGVDGSRDPVLTPETSVYYAENVVFRGGAGPRTRPGFECINLFNGFTEFDGAISILANGSVIQCATTFSPPNREPVLVLVVEGKVVVLDIVAKKIYYVSKTQSGSALSDFANKTASCYACQVEGFLVIQDGSEYDATVNWTNGPKILSFPSEANAVPFIELSSKYCQGSALTRLPAGRQMAYGQGRLFVTGTSGREIIAGDIAFGGSLVAINILTSTASTTRPIFTTATNHTFVAGDYVTISGHSASPAVNGTFRVESVPAANQFTIATEITSPGSGGYASEFNAGQASDALNFSETTFINEGGSLLIPLYMGSVKALTFLPIQDVSTGQGDLIVFGEGGAVSFSVSTPRTKWKETAGFQRILFTNIGSLSESTISINGDIYFRSREGNGIRTYRNARAEFGGFGMTPISAELDPVFFNEDLTKLSQVSMIHFDDRMLMTCKPATVNGRLVYKGITALDFRPSSVNNGKGSATYDGVWVGLQVISLLKGTFQKEERAFAVCYHGDDINQFQLWEITKNAKQDKNHRTGNEYRLIRSLVLTKGYDFKSPFSEKKLIHGDLWFSDVGGWDQSKKKFTADLKFRPDSNPNWTNWGDWELCFSEDNPNSTTDLVGERGYAPQLRAVVPDSATINGFTSKSIGRGYDFKIRLEWRGRAKLEKLLLHSIQMVEPVGAGSQVNSSCVRVIADQNEETLDNIYKSWEADGTTLDFFIQLTTDSTDFLALEDGGLLVGDQLYI